MIWVDQTVNEGLRWGLQGYAALEEVIMIAGQ